MKKVIVISTSLRHGSNSDMLADQFVEWASAKKMNIEDYREFCLSLGEGIEEKLPFQKFKNGEGVLVFYVMGHMFSFFDCNDFSVISLKCQPERIEDLKALYECIGNPYNESPKHWIGIDPNSAPDDLLQELTRNSYEIVKAKYTKKWYESFCICNFSHRSYV